MSAEARRWLGYAEENRRAAELCLQANLFNPCLQNAQQAVEKALKALISAVDCPSRRPTASGNFGEIFSARR